MKDNTTLTLFYSALQNMLDNRLKMNLNAGYETNNWIMFEDMSIFKKATNLNEDKKLFELADICADMLKLNEIEVLDILARDENFNILVTMLNIFELESRDYDNIC